VTDQRSEIRLLTTDHRRSMPPSRTSGRQHRRNYFNDLFHKVFVCVSAVSFVIYIAALFFELH